MKYKKLIVATLTFFIAMVSFFFILTQMTRASGADEPYSIVFLAGQSWAEGTNSFRANLPIGTGIDKQNHPADTQTGLWWAGADGNGPRDIFEFLNLFYNGVNPAGWIQSGGPVATGSQRLRNLNDTQRGGLFGPELGIGRELYDKGRRKVIVLKVSYGFQSLAQSASPMVPFDFNSAPGRNKSYQRMLTEFQNLTGYLNSIGQKYTVDGFYWFQGGTDVLQTEYANQYQANFNNLINAARTDFQLHPAAHIVVAKFSFKQCLERSYPLDGEYCGFPYAKSIDPIVVEDLSLAHPNFANRYRQVRDALQTVADSDQNDQVKVSIFETNDIPMSSDSIHHSELGNIEAGRRFVNMYKLPLRVEGSNDYDNDGLINSAEDVGRGAACTLVYNTTNNGNLGDDDTDCDGYPNYLDRINGPGSGLLQ